ncbi:amino acid adenylation domain-containing protein [Pseudomonas sp. B21-054]|uniref:amino acid adenylation domain-containing protein n=1 Tax=Pseudomonas sp. B21-054 TaxID=2895494 RepID=UPI00222F5D30|nr:amino acid adenylation domain-containing protein [Pseudomonas sp. B21-054]UZE15800.1 amino acid adenylation domain-containing protein [Pseudomonas sp. B21-054]
MNDFDDALLALLQDDELQLPESLQRQSGAGPQVLSFAQQRLWFLQRLEPNATAYNLSRAFLFTGTLNVPALRLAFEALIKRHGVLRTRFIEIDGEPRQELLDDVAFVMQEHEMPGVDRAARHEHLASLLALEDQSAFVLSQAPLLEVKLIRYDVSSHALLLKMHHIVSDAWSNPILVGDLASAYTQAVRGETPTLPPLPVQYVDYAIWQRQRLDTDAVQADLGYWKNYLGASVPVLELPTDFPRPAQQSQRGQRLRFTLDPVQSARIQAFCRDSASTPFVILLAAWQLLLARFSGQQTFAVGVPHGGRSREELEQLLGFFVNTLVYRVQLDPQLTGRALCQRLRSESLSALQHAELPFELLLDHLEIERDVSRTPVFQAMFNLSTGAAVNLALPGLEVERVLPTQDSAKFDLTLDVAARPDGVHCELEYNLDLFSPVTAERLAGCYRQLLDGLLTRPDVPVWQLPMLDDAQRLQHLEAWNRTERTLLPNQGVPDLFERQVDAGPDRCALISGEQPLSYAALNARANRLAHWLRAAGVVADQRVGVCLDRDADLLVTLLAIQKSGGAYLPIDPGQPAARNADIVEQARPGLVLTREALRDVVGSAARVVTLETLDDALPALPDTNLERVTHPRQLAYTLYTSGSTGRPKGVDIECQAFVNFLLGIQEHVQLSSTDRLLAVTTLGFDIAGLELFLPLIQGATVVLASREAALDPPALIDLLERHAITVMQATPATWQMLVDHPSAAWKGLRVLCGGEALGAELAERLLARQVKLLNVYGPTETTVWSAVQEVERVDSAVIPIGQPLANNRLYVLDEFLEPQPVGVAGDLYIGGSGVARGYADRPELTAASFVPNPFVQPHAPGVQAGSRLYRTGDRARYRTDGGLEFLGRSDFQIKLRGFRIEPGEIEAALAALPGVAQAVVVMRRGPGNQDVLVAYLCGEIIEVDSAAVTQRLRERLPAYMIPGAFVVLTKLPLNANGKIDRKALPEPLWNVGAVGEEPIGEWQTSLAEIWKEVLGVWPITADADLFRLGAQSLQLVRIQARIRHQFGCEVALAQLFAHPVLSDMAALIEQACATPEVDELTAIENLLLAFE